MAFGVINTVLYSGLAELCAGRGAPVTGPGPVPGHEVGMEARLPDGTVLDAEDVDVIVGLLQTALPRRTREEAASCLSRHAWDLQSALQHIQGPAGLEQGV